MAARRPLQKRIALVALAAGLVLTWYVTVGPILCMLAYIRCPAAVPIVEVVFHPLIYWRMRPELLGSQFHQSYWEWWDGIIVDLANRGFI